MSKEIGSKIQSGFTVLLLLASMLEGVIGFASAQPTEVVAGGELEYQQNCAVCHGAQGRGDGVMRRYLTVQPANLRILARSNGGKFPFWKGYTTKLMGKPKSQPTGRATCRYGVTAFAHRLVPTERPR